MRYASKLLDREIIAGEIMLLRFQKPEGFGFVAGQFCFMVTPDLGYHDQESLRRPFSIASSPLENELIFTVRLTESAFKKTLKEMPVGSAVALDSPLGLFTLPKETATPLVFLAGGVGVSPFRSMMRYAADASTGHKITLLYSSRVPEEAVFLDEFRRIAKGDPRMTVVVTITRPDRSREKWTGLTGRVTPEMVKEQCKDWAQAVHYVSGPPVMVDGMKNVLVEMGVDQQRVKREVWAGY
jgi:ferredoxin-NADP reductase